MQLVPPVLAQDKVSDSLEEFSQTIGVSGITTPGDLLSQLLPFLLIFAGLILMVMLIIGGFEMLTSGQNPEAAEKGKKRITTAIIGFLIIFAAFWLAQILQITTGINFLGGNLGSPGGTTTGGR